MPGKQSYEDKIPFRFILDYLTGVDIVIKPMFGCHCIYAHGKLCFFLMGRDQPLTRPDGGTMHKGISFATTTGHIEELKAIFTDAEFRLLKENKVWIFVPEASEQFEQYVIKACEMIRSRDPRIGR